MFLLGDDRFPSSELLQFESYPIQPLLPDEFWLTGDLIYRVTRMERFLFPVSNGENLIFSYRWNFLANESRPSNIGGEGMGLEK